jgi:hypothetical protein
MKANLLSSLSLFFVLLIISLGCTDSEFKSAPKKLDQPNLTFEEERRLILLDTSYRYPVESATKDALQIAAELDKTDLHKGKITKRLIGEVISYSIPDTIRFPKSSDRKHDPGFYVFNFSENKGFAIISGDKRVMGRFGYSGSGKLDNSPHTGLRIFMSRVVNYIQAQRKSIESMRGDASYFSLIKKLNSFKSQANKAKDDAAKSQANAKKQDDIPCPERTTDDPCDQGCSMLPYITLNSTSNSTYTQVQPIITTEWDQCPPYNNYFASGCSLQYNINCLSYSNVHYDAGCVPVSEAQVIIHYYARNNPVWYAIANTDICSMNATQVDQVASLIKNVYNQYSISFRSCSTGTFTFDQNFLGLTNDYGISPTFGLVQGEWRGYNNGDLENSLNNGSPVLVLGSQHEWCLLFNWACGPDPTCMHQWIMDGLQRVNQVSYYTIYPIDYSTCTYLPRYDYTTSAIINTYVHNNWGWGPPGANGWYLEGQFGGANSSGVVPNQPSNNPFNHDDKIVAYITPL